MVESGGIRITHHDESIFQILWKKVHEGMCIAEY